MSAAIFSLEALHMHGQPVRIETQTKTIFGEVEVTNELGCGPRAHLRCVHPVGGGTFPDAPQWGAASFVQRVSRATQKELVDFLMMGRDIPTPGWSVGKNEWVVPRDGHLPSALQGLTDWKNGGQPPEDRGFRGVTFHTFEIREVEPHTRYDTYILLDGTTIETPVRGWKFQLKNGVWIDGRGKRV